MAKLGCSHPCPRSLGHIRNIEYMLQTDNVPYAEGGLHPLRNQNCWEGLISHRNDDTMGAFQVHPRYQFLFTINTNCRSGTWSGLVRRENIDWDSVASV